MNWNEEAVETLKKLWSEGLSFTLIAGRMDCSRNAVIGKANRLGLRDRKPTTRKARMLTEPSAPAPSLNVALFNLTKTQCRYPYGDKAPFLFCGHPVQDESSYCPAHKALCEIRYERPPETKTYAPARGRAA